MIGGVCLVECGCLFEILRRALVALSQVLDGLDIVKQVGENRPLVRKIEGLEPNAQGKLLLEFVPVTRYATVTAIEVMPE